MNEYVIVLFIIAGLYVAVMIGGIIQIAFCKNVNIRKNRTR